MSTSVSSYDLVSDMVYEPIDELQWISNNSIFHDSCVSVSGPVTISSLPPLSCGQLPSLQLTRGSSCLHLASCSALYVTCKCKWRSRSGWRGGGLGRGMGESRRRGTPTVAAWLYAVTAVHARRRRDVVIVSMLASWRWSLRAIFSQGEKQRWVTSLRVFPVAMIGLALRGAGMP